MRAADAAPRRARGAGADRRASTACSTRLEDERREAGRAVLRAQEQERARIAQDLHDEVNQALTAILLRLSATIGDAPAGLRARAAGDAGARRRRRWTSCSRSPASCARRRSTTTAWSPRSPRRSPTSASAPASRARFHHHGAVPDALRRGAARDLPRHAGEPLQHRPARRRRRRRRRALVRRPHDAARPRRRRRLRRRAAQARQRPRARPPRRPRPRRHARARAAGRRPASTSSPRPARAPPSN